MRSLVAILVASALACAQTPATKLITPVQVLKKADNSAGGLLTINKAPTHTGTFAIQGPDFQLNAGEDYINSLVGNLTGKTVWALGRTSSQFGLLRLSNGTGSGGCDSNGAQVFATALGGGFVCVTNAVTVGLSATQQNIIDQTQITSVSTPMETFIGQPSTNVAIKVVNNSVNYNTQLGGDFLFSQNGSAKTVWALGTSGGKGLLRLSDGTGAGGFDGIGSTVYCLASSGTCQAQTLQTINSNMQTTIGDPLSNIGIQVLNNSTSNTTNIGGGTVAVTNGSFITDIGNPATSVNIKLRGAGTNYSYFGEDFHQIRNSSNKDVAVIAVSSNAGILRLLDGSGSGGFDGIGSTILLTGSSGKGEFGSLRATNIASGTQCVQADSSGNFTGTGAACGSGSSSFSSAAWTSYTPSTTNLSSVSSTGGHNQYGKTAFFRVLVTGTSNGSTPTITLPFTAATNDQTFACTVALSGATVPCSVVVSSSTMTIHIYDNSAFGNGNVYTFIIAGSMETT